MNKRSALLEEQYLKKVPCNFITEVWADFDRGSANDFKDQFRPRYVKQFLHLGCSLTNDNRECVGLDCIFWRSPHLKEKL